jgi:hypothetical protein
MRFTDHRLYSKGIGASVFGSVMLYHLATAPVTKRLHKECIKAAGMGMLAGFAYFKF